MDTVNINVYQKTIEFIANKMGYTASIKVYKSV